MTTGYVHFLLLQAYSLPTCFGSFEAVLGRCVNGRRGRVLVVSVARHVARMPLIFLNVPK